MANALALLNYRLVDKACELDIDPMLFTTTLRYLLEHPKERYEKDDTVAVLMQAAKNIQTTRLEKMPEVHTIDLCLASHKHVAEAAIQFAAKHKPADLISFVLLNAFPQIQMLHDYYSMQEHGFTDKDITAMIENS